MPRILPTELFALLSKHVGQDSAGMELRWLRAAARDPHHLQSLVSRRTSGEPLQYILGTQPFGPLELLTRRPVLIPRPETEHWTLRLAELIHPSSQDPISLLDLCTGSGCIPLLLCHLWPPGSVQAVGADISSDAIQLAVENAHRCGIHVSTFHSLLRATDSNGNTFTPLLADIRSLDFAQSSALRSPFHLITSNPPYITHEDYAKLSPSVKAYEDPRALLGDPQPTPYGKGLTFYHDIAKLAAREGFLARNGVVAVEVGIGQAEDVQRIFQEEGRLRETEIWRDPWEVQRVVIGRR
ncbi:hypothetical protein EIP91_007329 [Steccherinum ochraceum]|uniref:Uncharacterized protein n=1 Tax=Steccherinum ochraceum TaxID=92696 RepID=A0A4R0RWF7_9APHY|nr:hypothetical protein EIP91_007329 [Steccherinum ochraceum]